MTEDHKLIFQCRGKGFVSIAGEYLRIGVVVPTEIENIAPKTKNIAFDNEVIIWKNKHSTDRGMSELIKELQMNGVKDEILGYSGDGHVQAFDDGNMRLTAFIQKTDGGFIEAYTVCGTSDLSMVKNELDGEI